MFYRFGPHAPTAPPECPYNAPGDKVRKNDEPAVLPPRTNSTMHTVQVAGDQAVVRLVRRAELFCFWRVWVAVVTVSRRRLLRCPRLVSRHESTPARTLPHTCHKGGTDRAQLAHFALVERCLHGRKGCRGRHRSVSKTGMPFGVSWVRIPPCPLSAV